MTSAVNGSRVPSTFDPRTGHAQPAPPESSPAETDEIVREAARAATPLAATAPRVRQEWLHAVADTVDDHVEELARLADTETALGLPRLRGEAARAAAALRFYAAAAVDGSYLAATVEHADVAGAQPDLRRCGRPLGPVAVFGASNFPFGFGVLGHDTGSALAAGCPVIVKAHPAHPLLSARLGELARAALAGSGTPDGAFGVVHGFDAGRQLVLHPSMRAVAFTGSQAGGLALWQLAATRDVVIPVYAEMGTVNTVVVTDRGVAARGDEIAAGFVDSFTLGVGQFCTKPGLLLTPAGSGMADRVAAALRDRAAGDPDTWMLTSAIAEAFHDGVERLLSHGAALVEQVGEPRAGWSAVPTVLSVDPEQLVADPALLEECFGPAALVCEYDGPEQRAQVLDALPGSLAAAVHGATDDPDVPDLVATLAAHAGRVVVDGWPTGVAVSRAQQHGGPWPATTVPSATSVGGPALERFVRPVAFQNVPDPALPPALQDANPWAVRRRVDGEPDR